MHPTCHINGGKNASHHHIMTSLAERYCIPPATSLHHWGKDSASHHHITTSSAERHCISPATSLLCVSLPHHYIAGGRQCIPPATSLGKGNMSRLPHYITGKRQCVPPVTPLVALHYGGKGNVSHITGSLSLSHYYHYHHITISFCSQLGHVPRKACFIRQVHNSITVTLRYTIHWPWGFCILW